MTASKHNQEVYNLILLVFISKSFFYGKISSLISNEKSAICSNFLNCPMRLIQMVTWKKWLIVWYYAQENKLCLRLMQITINAKVKFKWQKNLVHSFYYILYQPKGVPSPIHNFSSSGGRFRQPQRVFYAAMKTESLFSLVSSP